MNCIAALSSLSDWMCGNLVAKAAQQYASWLYTPPYFIELLLWIEDKRFAVHFGTDPFAVTRALVFNLGRRGSVIQGASTIAQQVYTIRLREKGEFSRSLAYKVKQSAWSVYASAMMGKAFLLREYIGTVYWGRSYCGIDNAAKGYFNVSRDALSISQSFFLAERLAAPNRVSVPRIANLLSRVPIDLTLARNGGTLAELVSLYEQIYGCGGEMWLSLEKYCRPSGRRTSMSLSVR